METTLITDKVIQLTDEQTYALNGIEGIKAKKTAIDLKITLENATVLELWGKGKVLGYALVKRRAGYLMLDTLAITKDYKDETLNYSVLTKYLLSTILEIAENYKLRGNLISRAVFSDISDNIQSTVFREHNAILPRYIQENCGVLNTSVPYGDLQKWYSEIQ